MADDLLHIHTIYNKFTREFPGWFVVRVFYSTKAGLRANVVAGTAKTIEELREPFEAAGLYRQPRQFGDDPTIVESWF
jgi:hypothetical protein